MPHTGQVTCDSRPTPSSTTQALLDAVIAISSDLGQHSVLTAVVEAACQLTGAQYGARDATVMDGARCERPRS